MRPASLAFLKSLVAAPSPSGFEHPVAKLHREYTGEFADQVSTDVHGNVTDQGNQSGGGASGAGGTTAPRP